VDLGYAVRVEADSPPVLPDGRAGLVWLSDGTLRVCGPETRVWRPDRVGVTAVGVAAQCRRCWAYRPARCWTGGCT